MKKGFLKEIFLSICYLFLIAILMLIINYLITQLFEHVIFNMLDWFNRKSFWLKIILLLLGIGGVLSLLINITGLVTDVITTILLQFFPLNWFTLISGLLVGLINSVICSYQLWQAIPFWNVWFILEFIVLVAFIFSISFMVIPRSKKSK